MVLEKSMNDKKFQIFISSTYNDLINERQKVRDAILSLNHFPVGMEVFGAANENQWEKIKKTLDTTDYYVLLLAFRYGSIIKSGPDAGMSYTEKEYHYAEERGIPILAFVLDENAPISKNRIDANHQEELERFKQEVMGKHLIDRWTTQDDLASKVISALSNEINTESRPGWVRLNSDRIIVNKLELLNLKNRIEELESENKSLKLNYQPRAPKLDFSITLDLCENEKRNLSKFYGDSDFGVEKTDGSLAIKVYQLDEKAICGIRDKYRPISIDSVPDQLRDNISTQDIEVYNSVLPDKNEIEDYINDFKLHITKRLGIAVKCCVHNNGTSKANDISVTIKSPKEVLLLKSEDVNSREEPKAPALPENPIEKELKNRNRDNKSECINSFNSKAFETFLNNHISEYYGNNIKVEKNVAEISFRSILHSKNDFIKGLYLAATKPGKYVLECSILCEEFTEPDIQHITIIAE